MPRYNTRSEIAELRVLIDRYEWHLAHTAAYPLSCDEVADYIKVLCHMRARITAFEAFEL